MWNYNCDETRSLWKNWEKLYLQDQIFYFQPRHQSRPDPQSDWQQWPIPPSVSENVSTCSFSRAECSPHCRLRLPPLSSLIPFDLSKIFLPLVFYRGRRLIKYIMIRGQAEKTNRHTLARVEGSPGRGGGCDAGQSRVSRAPSRTGASWSRRRDTTRPPPWWPPWRCWPSCRLVIL